MDDEKYSAVSMMLFCLTHCGAEQTEKSSSWESSRPSGPEEAVLPSELQGSRVPSSFSEPHNRASMCRREGQQIPFLVLWRIGGAGKKSYRRGKHYRGHHMGTVFCSCWKPGNQFWYLPLVSSPSSKPLIFLCNLESLFEACNQNPSWP